MSKELKRVRTFLWTSLLATVGVLLSPSYIYFLDLFCLSSLSQSRANYSMSCLSNSKAFVRLALRLIGLCGLPESRCYIIDAVSLFSVYRQYTNKLPPLWHKHWDSAYVCDCVCVSTTCSHFSVHSRSHCFLFCRQDLNKSHGVIIHAQTAHLLSWRYWWYSLRSDICWISLC